MGMTSTKSRDEKKVGPVSRTRPIEGRDKVQKKKLLRKSNIQRN